MLMIVMLIKIFVSWNDTENDRIYHKKAMKKVMVLVLIISE